MISRQAIRHRAVCCFLFIYLFCWVGELFITHTWTCNERNHKCQTEGHPQPKLQATLTTWVEADTKVCKEATCQANQAAHKAVVHQPTAKPVSFQQTKHHLCLNQPNIAVKITSIMKCQAKQAADKTVAHHQYAKCSVQPYSSEIAVSDKHQFVHRSQQGLNQQSRNLDSQTGPLAYTSGRRYSLHASSADICCLTV